MNRLLFSILRVFPCIKSKIIKKKWRKKVSVRNIFLTRISINFHFFFIILHFIHGKPLKIEKKQSVHLFFSFFLNAQIFFLPFEQIFPRFIRKKKNWLWNPLEFLVACGHSKFQNWVPSPIFSSLWTC